MSSLHAVSCTVLQCKSRFQRAHTRHAGKRQKFVLTISTTIVQDTVKTIIRTKTHLQSRAGNDSVLNMSSSTMQRRYYLQLLLHLPLLCLLAWRRLLLGMAGSCCAVLR